MRQNMRSRKLSILLSSILIFYPVLISGCSAGGTNDGDREGIIENEGEADSDQLTDLEEGYTEEEFVAEEDPEPEPEPPPDPGFDNYFGSLRYETEATGFFRVELIGEQWWLITPDGHPFFSAGINVVGIGGTATHDGVHHYRDAAMEKYGTEEVWRDAQVQRMIEWGWNTIGAWSGWPLFTEHMPYTIIQYVAGVNWNGEGPDDFFTGAFAQKVRDVMEEKVAPRADDPNLIGYFFDNEMHWTHDLYHGDHLMVGYMAMAAETSPGKVRLMDLLKERYTAIEDLKEDFETDAADWEALALETELPHKETQGALGTRAAWNTVVAERYFGLIDTEFRAVDANHMNLGVRFVSQLCPRSVIEVAGRYVDVMTINYYDLLDGMPEMLQGLDAEHLPIANHLEAHYVAGGKPILISEWGMAAMDAGLPNTYPPIYPVVDTQEDRADYYENRFRIMLEKPWIVGQHWFLYADQPPEGRFDGEDNNFGLISEADEPYTPLVERSAMMHQVIYDRLPWPAQ